MNCSQGPLKRRKGIITCSPPGDHNGKDASPDRDEGNGIEDRGGDGSHDIGPHSSAVHDAVEPAQVALEQRAVLPAEHNLKVTLRSSTVA